MAKNEAKIKFTAETAGFNDAIKKSNSEMSELRAELKLNEAQMKTAGASVEALEAKHEILTSQLETAQDKTEALSQKVDKAKEIYGENSTEVAKLRTELLNAQTAEEKIKQAIAQCNEEIREQKSASEQSETASERLTSTIKEQESEMERLKREYVDAALQYGKNSDEAKDLGKQIEKLSGELKENKKHLNDAEKASDEYEDSLEELSEETEKVGEKMDLTAAGIVALGAGIIGFGKSAMDAFNEFDEGADNIIKATGATGEAAAGLEESYKNVTTEIVGSFDEIGSSMGEINTRFGYTDEALETASIKFQKFSEITGVDATEAVQSVSRALNDAGIPLDEYDVLLDQLAKAGQTAGIDVTTLTNSLSENGSIMRSMGFSTEETIALLSQFEVSGANSSVILGGMKKAMSVWADAGADGNVEFGKMVEGIKNGSVSASDAIDVFGSKAGPMLVDAIKSGKFEYQDMLSVIENSKGTVETTFDGTVDGGYEMELAMQNCKVALADVGAELGEALTPALQYLSDPILPALTDAFSAVVDFVKDAVNWFSEHEGVAIALGIAIGVLTAAIIAHNVAKAVKTAMDAAEVTSLGALIALKWANVTATLASVASYALLFAGIAAVIAVIVLCIKYWDEIVAAVKIAAEAVVNALGAAWKWFTNLVSNIAGWIYDNVIKPVVDFFVGAYETISSGLVDAYNGIVAFITGIPTWINENIIMPISQFFADLWLGIKNAAVSCWEGIKSVFTTISNWVNTYVITPVVNLFVGAWEFVKNTAISAWNGIQSVFSTIRTWISTYVITPVKKFFSNLWEGFTSGARKAWEGVKSVFSKVGSFFSDIFSTVKEKILSVFSAGGKLFVGIKDGIVDVFKTVVNGIIRGLNTVIALPFKGLNGILDTIQGIGFLGIEPFSWLTWRAPVPQIPLLAEGGIVDRPTLNIAGEAGTEAIIPIEKLEGYIAGAVEKAMGIVNISALAAAVEDLANRPIVMNINGRRFATATAGDSDNVNGIRSSFLNRGLILD